MFTLLGVFLGWTWMSRVGTVLIEPRESRKRWTTRVVSRTLGLPQPLRFARVVEELRFAMLSIARTATYLEPIRASTTRLSKFVGN